MRWRACADAESDRARSGCRGRPVAGRPQRSNRRYAPHALPRHKAGAVAHRGAASHRSASIACPDRFNASATNVANDTAPADSCAYCHSPLFHDLHVYIQASTLSIGYWMKTVAMHDSRRHSFTKRYRNRHWRYIGLSSEPQHTTCRSIRRRRGNTPRLKRRQTSRRCDRGQLKWSAQRVRV